MKPEERILSEGLGGNGPWGVCKADVTPFPAFGGGLVCRDIFEWDLGCPPASGSHASGLRAAIADLIRTNRIDGRSDLGESGARPNQSRVFRLGVQPLRTVHPCLRLHVEPATSGGTAFLSFPSSAVDESTHLLKSKRGPSQIFSLS